MNYNLENNYIDLLKYRTNINKISNEEQTLNSSLDNSNIKATSNYYNYILYSIIAVFLILLLIKFSITYTQNGGSNLENYLDINKNLKTYLMISVILVLLLITFR
jgi:uncharacterized membrane protein YecN with MAPEG domain